MCGGPSAGCQAGPRCGGVMTDAVRTQMERCQAGAMGAGNTATLGHVIYQQVLLNDIGTYLNGQKMHTVHYSQLL